MTGKTALRNILVLSAIILITFCNSLFNGFVWDDNACILKDSAIIHFNVADLLLKQANGLEYIPLHSLTLGIDHLIWGFNPFGFHLTNVLVFLATIIALYLTVSHIRHDSLDMPRTALWSCVLFAVHPIHAEPVNFISNRCHLLALMFVVFSLYWFVRWLNEPVNKNLAISLICFILSILSKQSTVAFPVFVAAVLLLYKGPAVPFSRKLIAASAFAAIDAVAVFLHIRNAFTSSTAVSDKLIFMEGGLLGKLMKTVNIYSFYLRKFFFPAGLTTHYDDRMLHSGMSFYSLTSLAILLAAAGLAVYCFRRSSLTAAGIGWYSIMLIPAMNFFDTTPVVADRYALIPSAGLCLAAGYLIAGYEKRLPPLRYAAVGIMAFLAVLTIQRNFDWKSDYTLFKSAIQNNRLIDRTNYANALWQERKYAEALASLKEEMALTGSHNYYAFLGKFHAENGNYQDAVKAYKASLLQGGDAYKRPHLALARVYSASGDDLNAIKEYLKALDAYDMDPHGLYDAEAKSALDRLRRPFLSEADAMKSRLSADPGSLKNMAELGLLYQNIGLYGEAVASYDRLLEKAPTSWEAWHNKALCLSKDRKTEESIAAFDKAFALNPRNVDALNSIGSLYMKLKNRAKAEEYFKKAVATDPAHVFSVFNLARHYFYTGRKAEAREYLNRAIAVSGSNEAIRNRATTYLSRM